LETVHYTPEQLNERFSFEGKLKRNTLIALAVGIVLMLLGIFMTPGAAHEATTPAAHGEPVQHTVTLLQRFVAQLLHTNIFFFRIAIGSLMFIAFSNLTGGGWNTAIRRIPEAFFSSYLFIGFVVFSLIMFGFMDQIYEWVKIPVGEDHLIDDKRAYLNQPFFWVRNLLFFAVWGLVSFLMRKASVNEDNEGGLGAYNKTMTYSAAFIIFFALSYTFFSVDWLKSLEPHWFSTIYGVYNFAGTMVTTFTTIMLFTLILKRQGYMSYVNDSHLHDIGKFMFGFSVFWAYIWVSQFLLIWYSNMPEETIYYVRRIGGSTVFGMPGSYEGYTPSTEYLGYKFFFFFNIIANFVAPFLIFMTRNAKRATFILYPMCFFLLLGHWNDLYQLIMPGAVGAYSPSFASLVMEIGIFLTFAGVFCFAAFTSLAKAGLLAKKNVYLEESLQHSTGVI
jgi:hypothetical protein